jgi:hypothetical protein
LPTSQRALSRSSLGFLVCWRSGSLQSSDRGLGCCKISERARAGILASARPYDVESNGGRALGSLQRYVLMRSHFAHRFRDDCNARVRRHKCSRALNVSHCSTTRRERRGTAVLAAMREQRVATQEQSLWRGVQAICILATEFGTRYSKW